MYVTPARPLPGQPAAAHIGNVADTAPTDRRSPMTLPERLAAFRANFEAGGPPYHAPAWVHEAMHRATDELIASGAAERALKAGDRAPEFTLKDADGHEVSSRDLLAKGPLVVTFYRGVWCPYCNMDLQALREVLPAIVERGAQLVAISPQTQSNSRKSQRENKVDRKSTRLNSSHLVISYAVFCLKKKKTSQ